MATQNNSSSPRFKKGSIASITNPNPTSNVESSSPSSSSTSPVDPPPPPPPQPHPPNTMDNMPYYNHQLPYPIDQVNSTLYQQQAPSAPPPHMTHSPQGAPIPMPPYMQMQQQQQQQQQQVQQAQHAGHRKRHSGDALLSMDAPTQPRKYVSPSSTSKKELPSFYPSTTTTTIMPGTKRRARSQPSDEEDDELTEEPPAPNATEQEKVEWKRRQNTLAARRSRKRKLMYTQQLEGTVEKLTMEKEVWKTRTMTLKHLLHSHGIPCPDFKD